MRGDSIIQQHDYPVWKYKMPRLKEGEEVDQAWVDLFESKLKDAQDQMFEMARECLPSYLRWVVDHPLLCSWVSPLLGIEVDEINEQVEDEYIMKYVVIHKKKIVGIVVVVLGGQVEEA